MRQKIFKKYNIAGESNPYWQLVEPMLLKIWAKGICEASYPKLHSILFFDLLSSTFLFLAGFLLRVSTVALFLSIGYVFFKDSLLLAFSTVLSSDIGSSISISVDEEKIWIYKLLGYVILIKSVIFIFGTNFTYLMLDIMMYVLMTITNMLPLKWTARGLKKENYFAQYFAKTSYMGTLINQTILAAPPEIVSEWDKVSDLYKNSNNEDARKELERLSATY